MATPEGFGPDVIARAEAGDMSAMTALGVFHMAGVTGADPTQAAVWLRRAADGGDARAMSYLALAYLGGEAYGAPRDEAEALRLLRRSADLGRPAAMFNLGALYLDGGPVEADPAEAARWFEAAADHGYGPAMHMLALTALQAKDPAAALQWFARAADQGDRDAMIDLGRFYAIGFALPLDYAEAMRWYRRAADLGDARGQLYLGMMYDEGLGLPADPAEAVRWYRMAAEQDLREGAMAMEFAYGHGRGVAADTALAKAWRKRQIEAHFDVGDYGRSPFEEAFVDALRKAADPLYPDLFADLPGAAPKSD